MASFSLPADIENLAWNPHNSTLLVVSVSLVLFTVFLCSISVSFVYRLLAKMATSFAMMFVLLGNHYGTSRRTKSPPKLVSSKSSANEGFFSSVNALMLRSPLVRGLMTTSSPDKTVKVWDVDVPSGPPKLVGSKEMKIVSGRSKGIIHNEQALMHVFLRAKSSPLPFLATHPTSSLVEAAKGA